MMRLLFQNQFIQETLVIINKKNNKDFHYFYTKKLSDLIVTECANVLLEWKKEPFPLDIRIRQVTVFPIRFAIVITLWTWVIENIVKEAPPKVNTLFSFRTEDVKLSRTT